MLLNPSCKEKEEHDLHNSNVMDGSKILDDSNVGHSTN